MRPIFEEDEDYSLEDRPEAHEVIIGRSQRQRSTKTHYNKFIDATMLAIIGAKTKARIRVQQALLEREGVKVNTQQVVANSKGIHLRDSIVFEVDQRFVSVNYVGLQMAVRAEALSHQDRRDMAREASPNGANGSNGAGKFDA